MPMLRPMLRRMLTPMLMPMLTPMLRPMLTPMLLLTLLSISGYRVAHAQSSPSPLTPRSVPAKSVPVPLDVSPGMQKIIAAPLNPDWNVLWSTGEEWRAAANRQAEATLKELPALRERLHVSMTSAVMHGVRVNILTPDSIPPEHRDKVLIQVHGGCYVLFPGVAGTQEAVMMAGFGHYQVIAVDYRMPPEAYFPAALDDAVTVYQEVLKKTKAQNVGVLGTSAGGALVLEMMLRARQLGIAMPGAIAPSTPMSDVTKVGDSFSTNAMVDNVLVSPNGFCDAATRVYAHGHDLSDPLLSPVYGDMKGFPPAILTTGTRDLLLSNTVRVHRKLREAGVDAELEVYEGQSHAQFGRDDRLPETREAYGEIVNFFEKHLGHP
jgi:monoterpene epsilon-lactone hydrolase